MKNKILFLIIVAFAVNTFSQDSKPAIGKLSYYEGVVKLFKAGDWQKAKLNQGLFEGDIIQTGKESVAELEWVSGKKTSLGSSSQQDVYMLYTSSDKNVKEKTGHVISKFLDIFKKETQPGKQQEGGIRRDLFDSNSSVTFEQANSFYEAGDFLKALNAFSVIFEKNSEVPEAKNILFAKGHCLLELNNFVEAQLIFTDFIKKYPDSDLVPEAKRILEEL